jgi:hypothetical protein
VASRFQATSFSVAGSVTWLSGSVSEELQLRPAIWSVDATGLAQSHAILFEGTAVLAAIDVMESGEGIAGGMRLEDTSGPLVLHGRAGEPWREAAVGAQLDNMVVRGVVFSSAGDAWAVAHGHGTTGSAILLSTDRGETWQRLAAPFDDRSFLFAIASAPEE